MLAMKHLGGASSTNSAQILYARQPTYRERLRLGTNRTSRTNHQLESTRVRAAAGNSMLRYGVRALLGASAACASAAASGIFLISACALVPPLGAILFISYISSEVFFAADTARKQWLKLNSLQRSPLVTDRQQAWRMFQLVQQGLAELGEDPRGWLLSWFTSLKRSPAQKPQEQGAVCFGREDVSDMVAAMIWHGTCDEVRASGNGDDLSLMVDMLEEACRLGNTSNSRMGPSYQRSRSSVAITCSPSFVSSVTSPSDTGSPSSSPRAPLLQGTSCSGFDAVLQQQQQQHQAAGLGPSSLSSNNHLGGCSRRPPGFPPGHVAGAYFMNPMREPLPHWYRPLSVYLTFEFMAWMNHLMLVAMGFTPHHQSCGEGMITYYTLHTPDEAAVAAQEGSNKQNQQEQQQEQQGAQGLADPEQQGLPFTMPLASSATDTTLRSRAHAANMSAPALFGGRGSYTSLQLNTDTGMEGPSVSPIRHEISDLSSITDDSSSDYMSPLVLSPAAPRGATQLGLGSGTAGAQGQGQPSPATPQAPIMLLHGVGMGLLPYARLLISLAATGAPIIAVECKQVGQRWCESVPNLEEMREAVKAIIHRHGWRPPHAHTQPQAGVDRGEADNMEDTQAAAGPSSSNGSVPGVHILAHSFGTAIASAVLQGSPPGTVLSLALSDPICFHMWQASLMLNFIYRPQKFLTTLPSASLTFKGKWLVKALRRMSVRGALASAWAMPGALLSAALSLPAEWAKEFLLIGPAREMHCTAALCRRLDWHTASLTAEALEGRPCIIALSGKDELLPADKLAQWATTYTSASVQLSPELRHADILLDVPTQTKLITSVVQNALAAERRK